MSITAVTEFTFNRDPLITQEVNFLLPIPEMVTPLHYVPINRAVQCNPFLREWIEQIPLRRLHRNVYVDLRAKVLRTGEWPSLDKWHMDLVTHPLDESRPEYHHIFVSGCNAPTLFLKGPTTLPIPEPGVDALPALNRLIRETGVPFIEAEEGKLITFNRFHLHKGQQAKIDGVRYILRVTETDLNRKSEVG